ncbi:MAG: PIG-L family deacetylase [Myxococcota bacterium]
MSSTLHALAVGPHPDDVELFCGGTIVRLVQQGHRVGILDLTAGELASNGTVPIRRAEAQAAAEVMGVALRDNLALPDGGLQPGTDDEQVRAAADAVRRLRPELMFVPWIQARHPDHSAAGHLMRKAAFVAGLTRYET